MMGELAHTEPSAEELGRAETYRLLAFLFDASPRPELLEALGAMQPDDSELGCACAALANAARTMDREAISDEYGALFDGMPAAQLMPYGSYYANGQLFGQTLAELRADLSQMGVVRNEDATEPEDHIAILCEIMSGLITGAFQRPPLAVAEQAIFFTKHLQPWAPLFFAELERAPDAHFYKLAACLGRVFFSLENRAFKML